MSGINFGVPREDASVTNGMDRDGSDVMTNQAATINGTNVSAGTAENDAAAVNGTAATQQADSPLHHLDDTEVREWLESLDSVLDASGPEVATEILERLRAHATVSGIELPFTANTPYANTIPNRLEPLFPGDQELERRIKSLIRWNALGMGVRAHRVEHNIGGGHFPLAARGGAREDGVHYIFLRRAAPSDG